MEDHNTNKADPSGNVQFNSASCAKVDLLHQDLAVDQGTRKRHSSLLSHSFVGIM